MITGEQFNKLLFDNAELQREILTLRETEEIQKKVIDTMFEMRHKLDQEKRIAHGRYEKLRRLNVEQFARLFKAHLSSAVQFDTMVDNLEQWI